MTLPTVVALNPLHPQALALASKHFDLILPGSERFDAWRQHAQGVLTISARVTKDDVVAGEKLRYVAKQGTGVDMLDLGALKEGGVVVMNTPGINVNLVWEDFRADRWVRGILTELISGGGDTGFALARMFQSAFHGHIILYDPYLSPGDSQRWERGIPPTSLTHTSSLNDLLARSDVVSLHCPLTKDTKGMMSVTQFELMKKSAILINVARGGIVDEEDLETALREKQISGAGVDVTVVEPPTSERYDRLCKSGCVITPHYGAAPEDVQEATCVAMVEHMIDALENGVVKNRVV